MERYHFDGTGHGTELRTSGLFASEEEAEEFGQGLIDQFNLVGLSIFDEDRKLLAVLKEDGNESAAILNQGIADGMRIANEIEGAHE